MDHLSNHRRRVSAFSTSIVPYGQMSIILKKVSNTKRKLSSQKNVTQYSNVNESKTAFENVSSFRDREEIPSKPNTAPTWKFT